MLAMKAYCNGFPIPDGMTITSPEFEAHLWEQARLGDERAVQAILGSKGKLALPPLKETPQPWTDEEIASYEKWSSEHAPVPQWIVDLFED